MSEATTTLVTFPSDANIAINTTSSATETSSEAITVLTEATTVADATNVADATLSDDFTVSDVTSWPSTPMSGTTSSQYSTVSDAKSTKATQIFDVTTSEYRTVSDVTFTDFKTVSTAKSSESMTVQDKTTPAVTSIPDDMSYTPFVSSVSEYLTQPEVSSFGSTVKETTSSTRAVNMTISTTKESSVSSTSSDTHPTVSISETTISGEITSTSPICKNTNGYYPNPSDCGTFYKCTKGKPTLSQCIGNEHFNPTDLLCQDPCMALCNTTINCPNATRKSTGSESTVTTSFTTAVGTDTTDEGSASISSITQAPSTTDGGGELASTAEPTSSDPETASRATDEPTEEDHHTSTSATDSEASTRALTETTQEPEPSTSDDKDDATFETTSDAVSDTAVLYTGDMSSVVTDESLSTTAVSPTSTASETTSALPSTIPGRATGSPVCGAGDGFYRKPGGTCDDFYKCVGERIFEFHCPKSLHFNLLKERCEYPCEAQCDLTINCSTQEPKSSPLPLTVCGRRDILPKPGHCEYYIDCTDGLARKGKCPRGLRFNPTKRVCDFPSRVDCGNPAKPLPRLDVNFKCPREAGLVPSAQKCSDYNLCLNGTAYHMKCSTGLLFDATINTCNFGNRVTCEASSMSTTTSTTKKPVPSTSKPTPSTSKPVPSTEATSAPRPFRCPQRNGMFRNANSCRSFFHCSNWWPSVKDCPGGLHFSVGTQRCEWPCDAKCDGNLSCVASSVPPATSDPACTCRDCLLPSPEGCSQYFVCRNGKSARRTCPRGKAFDGRRRVCDWAHRVSCEHGEKCSRRNGLFPYKADCHKFVHCSNGIPHIRTCPSELHFDPAKLRCEYPTGKCDSSVQDDAAKGKTNSSRNILFKWNCPSSFGYFKHQSDCSKFYLCSFGTSSLKQCPGSLYFNSKYQTCDWQQNVNCDVDEHHYQRRCRRFDRQVRCAQNRTYLIHPNCDMYYDCTTGKACAKRCPMGLFFNKETAMCDLPSNVNCMKRDGDLYSLKQFADVCRRTQRGQMRDPADESCFYRCQGTRVTRGCCSRGRLYNEHTDNCDWQYHG